MPAMMNNNLYQYYSMKDTLFVKIRVCIEQEMPLKHIKINKKKYNFQALMSLYPEFEILVQVIFQTE